MTEILILITNNTLYCQNNFIRKHIAMHMVCCRNPTENGVKGRRRDAKGQLEGVEERWRGLKRQKRCN